jgi:hypothetical protein
MVHRWSFIFLFSIFIFILNTVAQLLYGASRSEKDGGKEADHTLAFPHHLPCPSPVDAHVQTSAFTG